MSHNFPRRRDPINLDSGLPDYVSAYNVDIFDPVPPSVPQRGLALNTTGTIGPPTSPNGGPPPMSSFSSHSTGSTGSTGTTQRTAALLKMSYEEASVLLLGSSTFEDIEHPAREIFVIPDSTPIYVSAEISSFNNERMTIHRTVWSAICSDVSVIWITTVPQPARINQQQTTLQEARRSSPTSQESPPSPRTTEENARPPSHATQESSSISAGISAQPSMYPRGNQPVGILSSALAPPRWARATGEQDDTSPVAGLGSPRAPGLQIIWGTSLSSVDWDVSDRHQYMVD